MSKIINTHKNLFFIFTFIFVNCTNLSLYLKQYEKPKKNSLDDKYLNEVNYDVPKIVLPTKNSKNKNNYTLKSNSNSKSNYTDENFTTAHSLPKLKKIISKKKASNGKIITTSLSADILDRVEIGKNKKGEILDRIRLEGHAILFHDKIKITADKIILENNEKAHLTNNIVVYDSKNNIGLYAKEAFYKRKEQEIILIGSPYIIKKYKNKKENEILSCSRIIHRLDLKISNIEGEIVVSSNLWNLFADNGIYDQNNSTIILEKNPILISSEDYLKGEKLIYYQNKKQIELQNDVTFFTLKKSFRKNKLKYEKENYILTSDNLVYEPNVYILAKKNVILTRIGSIIKSNNLEIYGKDFNNINAKDDVYLHDDDEEISVNTKNLNYDKSKELIILSENIKVDYKKKDTIIKANYLERDLNKKYTKAYSEVNVEQNTKSKDLNEKTILKSEYAYFDEIKDLITMEGNPKVFKNNSFLSAQKIFVHPKKNQIFLENNINGGL